MYRNNNVLNNLLHSAELTRAPGRRGAGAARRRPARPAAARLRQPRPGSSDIADCFSNTFIIYIQKRNMSGWVSAGTRSRSADLTITIHITSTANIFSILEDV